MGIKNKIKKIFPDGISVLRLSVILSIITALIFVFTYRATIEVSRRYTELIRSIEAYCSCENAAQEIMNVSDVLTDDSRLYVSDGQREYLDRYFEEVKVKKRQEKALLEIKASVGSASTREAENAVQYSAQLRDREYYAMRLAADARGEDFSSYPKEIAVVEISEEDAALSNAEKIRRAENMLYDKEYIAQKNEIRSNINKYLKEIIDQANKRTENEAEKLKEKLHWQSGLLTVMLIVSIIVFASLIFLFIRPLDRFIKAVSDGETIKIEGAKELQNLAKIYNNMHTKSNTNMKQNKELKRSNITDPLTGVYNRKGFDEIKQRMENKDMKIAFILIDVDKFKYINDDYGHPIGDQALCIVADTLKKFFRSKDFIFRAGGDEFAVFMKDATEELSDTIINKIDTINAELGCYQLFEHRLSISAGAAFSVNGYNKEVYNAADHALYESKEKGRKCCSIYKETL